MNGFGRGEENQKKDRASVFTRETVGMTLLLFSAVLLLIAVVGRFMLGSIGVAINAFLGGLFGFLTYPVLILLLYFSVVLVFGKKFLPAKWVGLFTALLGAVFLVVHLATSERFCGEGYGAYLSGCWKAASESMAGATGVGVVFGLIVYPVRALLSSAGAYVVFVCVILTALYLIARQTPLKKYISNRSYAERKSGAEKNAPKERVTADGVRAYPAAVAFDDLPPARPAQDYREAPRPQTSEPVRLAYGDGASENAADRLSGRDILFTTDPATSYKNNLIFDRDSRFNTSPRRSSVLSERKETLRDEPQESVYPFSPERTEKKSYLDDYSAQAEAPRPTMPRKITEERQAPQGGYSYPIRSDEDVNYPQKPSYKAEPVAPKEEPQPARDYYSNDVPYEEEFSSAPNVSDQADVSAPEREESLPAPRTESVRPSFTAQAAAEEEDSPRAREAEFRSLFSRPRETRTEVSPLRDETFGSRGASLREEEDKREEETFAPSYSEEKIQRRVNPLSLQVPEEEEAPPAESRVFDSPLRGSARTAADLFDDDEDEEEEDYEEIPAMPETRSRAFGGRTPAFEASAESLPSEPAPPPKKHVYKQYVHPSVELFHRYDDSVTVSQEEIERNSAVIVETLAGFRVDAEVVKVTSGSAVTRYDIDIPRNIAVRSVVKHDAEIAMRLHARDGVNIYSNSEVGAISIEVPNSTRATVGIRSVLKAEEYLNAKPTALMFAIGKDVEGRNVCGNIVKMKHILVAGSTGSGKSVCLNAMLISLICKYSPQDLRLILIDPKKVEFAIFDGLPHLMINEIIADAQKAVSALNWSIKEMERRYLLFEQKTRSGRLVHNVDEYNANLSDDEEKLPKIVIVVDELADLMSVAKKDIEDRIQRLAQKARAAGIHLVIATQRPSVDVITGVIKGNLPTRMAFRVIQEVDSRTIIDSSGAEKLLGNGDMLYRTEGMFNCSRVQGAFLSSDEVQAIVEEIKANNEAYFDTEIADYINKPNQSDGGADAGDDSDGGAVDPQYIKALAIVVKLGSASISLIQRKCSVGYNHAGKIIEWMELMGYISPFDGKAKARTVLLTKEEFESKYGSID